MDTVAQAHEQVTTRTSAQRVDEVGQVGPLEVRPAHDTEHEGQRGPQGEELGRVRAVHGSLHKESAAHAL